MEASEGINLDIGSMSMEGDHAKKQLLHEKHMEVEPRVSPDGRWMAYGCNESGQHEVYVRPYPEVNGGKWKKANQIFSVLFYYPQAKSTGELAAAGKGGGTDSVVQLPAEGDLEMVLDMATAAKAVGDR